jgi:hypothetical protein
VREVNRDKHDPLALTQLGMTGVGDELGTLA